MGVKRGEFWGRFVRRPPRPKSKPSIVVPQENVPGDDLDFLDELAIDDQVDTQEDKDIMSEDYLLERASSTICENNNILRTDCAAEKCADTMGENEIDIAVHGEVNNSNAFVLDLFNTEQDILHRDLEELEEFQNK